MKIKFTLLLSIDLTTIEASTLARLHSNDQFLVCRAIGLFLIASVERGLEAGGAVGELALQPQVVEAGAFGLAGFILCLCQIMVVKADLWC